MNMIKHYFTKNQCYKVGERLKPQGFMIHCTGANNPYLWRYIDDPDNLGKNKYNNHWNQYNPSGRQVCVHGFIGKDKRGNVAVYNTLPENIVGWHCGYPGNKKYIAYEICEDNLKDKKYFNEAMDAATSVAAFYCKKYGWTEKQVLSHKEGHDRGEATNHGDINYWLGKHGKTMNWFRDEVAKKLEIKPAEKPIIYYQAYNDQWGAIIKDYTPVKYVGNKNKDMKAFGIRAANTDNNSPYIAYRVRKTHGDYFAWQHDRIMDKYGENFAGDKIHTFDRIQMTLKNCEGWQVKYRVYAKNKGWLPWVVGFNSKNSDGYAGWDGYPIRCIQVQIVRK